MRILITGGAGFIGSRLAEKLVSLKHEVIVFDNFENGKIGNLSKIQRKVKIINGDIRDKKIIDKSIQGVHIVFHLAAKVTVHDSFNHSGEFENVNTGGTLNLLELSKKHGVEKIIFASSAAVYGNTKSLPTCEDSPTIPISPLGKTKLAAERLCARFRNQGLDTVILRFFNAYGPRQNPAYSNVVSSFTRDILKDEAPVIFGDGRQTRDLIYVDDLVDACILAMENNTRDYYIFNIAAGKKYTVNQIFKIICKLLGKNPVPRYLMRRKGDIVGSFACTCKAEQYLNFYPKTSLEKGLEKTIQEL